MAQPSFLPQELKVCFRGNDFIKAFPSYRSQDFLCLENYQDAKLAKSDVLMVDEEASINTVSAGLDVKVAYHVDKFKQLPFAHGVLPYFLGLLVSMAGSISEDLIVEIDGRREAFSDYLFVVAGNGRCYGGGYCPAPKARVDDGWFDYSLIRKVSRAKIITLSGKYKKGTHLAYKEFVRNGRAKTMRIWTGGKRIRLNLDGELYETSDPLITLAEQKIHLALPNPRSGELGYPRNFTILDSEDQKSILKEIYKEQDVDTKVFSYPSMIGYISSCKTAFVSVQQAQEMAHLEGQRIRANVYAAYQKRLADMYALDFDDLLLFAHRLLKESEEVRAKWQRRFSYLHVDEFQDVDELQYAIIRSSWSRS